MRNKVCDAVGHQWVGNSCSRCGLSQGHALPPPRPSTAGFWLLVVIILAIMIASGGQDVR